jgi:hypothetical protein
MRLGKKHDPNLLQKYSLEEKENSNPEVVKKYLNYFFEEGKTKKYKSSDLVRELNKSENMVRRLKQVIFKKLQKLIQERNLHFLVE